MTTLTALSILIGKKRAIKVKDNFKFSPHRQCPQGSLGEAPTRRDRCQVSQLRVCVLGADQLRHQQHVAPWLSAPSLLVCNRKRSCCMGHVRGRGSGHHGVRMLSAGRWLEGSNPASLPRTGEGQDLQHQPVQILILKWPISCWANLGKPHPHPLTPRRDVRTWLHPPAEEKTPEPSSMRQ